jgi:hypothetical protein
LPEGNLQNGSSCFLSFSIRLDNAEMKIPMGWLALIRNTPHIGDFTKWKDHDSYQRSFERRLLDLKPEIRKERPSSA